MTKELNLSIGERLASIKILNDFKGPLSTLAIVLDDVKKFAVTEEDWKNANLKKTPTDSEIAALAPEKRATAEQTWKWEDTEAQAKTISVDQVTVDYIVKAIEDKSKANEITIADVPLVSLEKKLK